MDEKAIRDTILKMAGDRAPDKTVCPSEIARELFPADWRRQMAVVRNTAISLHQEGLVIITQKGAPVDVSHIKGPVRIKFNS